MQMTISVLPSAFDISDNFETLYLWCTVEMHKTAGRGLNEHDIKRKSGNGNRARGAGQGTDPRNVYLGNRGEAAGGNTTRTGIWALPPATRW